MSAGAAVLDLNAPDPLGHLLVVEHLLELEGELSCTTGAAHAGALMKLVLGMQPVCSRLGIGFDHGSPAFRGDIAAVLDKQSGRA
jgi:hypothetical protein